MKDIIKAQLFATLGTRGATVKHSGNPFATPIAAGDPLG